MPEAAFQHHWNLHAPGGGDRLDIGGDAFFYGLLDFAPDSVAFFPPFCSGDGQV